MYSVYIKNYKDSNNQIHTTEEQMYEVPIFEPERALTDPSGSTEMGKAGSFEASIKPGQIWYDCWLQMKTLVRVEYEDETIFRGRVLTIDNTLTGEKKLHFEGDLAFLLDSLQHGEKEADRSEISAGAYITELLEEHNRQMLEQGDDDKCIYPGEIPGQYSSRISNAMRLPNERKKFGSDGWQTTMDCLEELQNEFGGYFRTRYTAGTCYFDWLESWFNEEINPQPIKIGENLVSLSSSAEVENIFTALIPVGRDEGNDVLLDQKRILVPQVVDYYSGHPEKLNFGYHTTNDYATAVQKYGIIYKTQKFENADTKAKLLEYAMDWIRNNYCGGVVGFTVSAVDLHHLGLDVRKYMVGDRIRLTYPDIDSRANGVTPMVTKDATIVSISYNLHNPERNSYTIGTPNNVITRTYGTPVTKAQPTSTPSSTSTASTTTPTSSTSSSSKQAAQQQQEQKQQNYNSGVAQDENDNAFWSFLMNDKYNTKEYNTYQETYGALAGTGALKTSYIMLDTGVNKHNAETGEGEEERAYLRSILINGHNGEFSFHYYHDPTTGVDYDQLESFQAATNTMTYSAAQNTLTLKQRKDLIVEYDPDTGLPVFKPAVPLWQMNLNEDGTGYLSQSWVVDENDPEKSKTQYTSFMDYAKGSLYTANAFFGIIDEEWQEENSIYKFFRQYLTPHITISGKNSQISTATSESSGNFITSLLNGETGLSQFLSPENGGLTLSMNSLSGIISMFTGSGSGTDSDKTVEIDGKNGTQKIGKDLNGDWEITINEPIAYREWDEDKQAYVVHYTPKGTIKAADFSLPSVPSFHTKMAVIDQLIADKIDANEVRANYAQFNDLVASNITVTHPSSGTITDAQAWLAENTADIDTTGALLAEKIVAYDAKFHNIDVDILTVKQKLTASWIESTIADLDIVHVKSIQGVDGNSNIAVNSVSAFQRLYIGTGPDTIDLISNGIDDSVIDLQISYSNQNHNYTLQKKTISSNRTWTDVGTFSVASTLVGEWRGTNSSRYYYVYAEEDSDIHISSPTISADDVYIVGDPVWSNNKQSFTQSMRLDDEDGNTIVLFSHEFDTSESYEAGLRAGSGGVTAEGYWDPNVTGQFYYGLSNQSNKPYTRISVSSVGPSSPVGGIFGATMLLQPYEVYNEEHDVVLSGRLTVDATDAWNEGRDSAIEDANITSLTGSWNGQGTFTYSASTGVDSDTESTTLSSDWTMSGNPSWSDDEHVSINLIVSEEETGNTAIILEDIEINTSHSYNAGRNHVTSEGYWDPNENGRFYYMTSGRAGTEDQHNTRISVTSVSSAYPIGGTFGATMLLQPYEVHNEDYDVVLSGRLTVDATDAWNEGHDTAEAEAEATIESLQSQVETLREQLDTATDLCFEYRTRIFEQDAEIRELNSSLDQLYDEYDQLDIELQNAYRDYYDEVEAHEIDNANYQDAIDERNATIASMQETINELRREINSWNGVKHWGSFKLYYQNGYNMVVAGGSANNGVHDWYYFE